MAKRNVVFLQPGEKFSVGFNTYTVESVSKERWQDDNGSNRLWVSAKTDTGGGTNIPFKITDKVEVKEYVGKHRA